MDVHAAKRRPFTGSAIEKLRPLPVSTPPISYGRQPIRVTLQQAHVVSTPPISYGRQTARCRPSNQSRHRNGHGSLRVLSQPATPRTAAEHLNTGRCSAALLIADDRPWTLRRLDQPIFAAHLSLETGRQSIYLLLGTKDEALQVTLRETFAAVLADKHFQAIIQGRLPPPPTLALAH